MLGGFHIDNARGTRSSGNNFNLTLATENAPRILLVHGLANQLIDVDSPRERRLGDDTPLRRPMNPAEEGRQYLNDAVLVEGTPARLAFVERPA